MEELDNLATAVDAVMTMAAPDRTRQEIVETLRVVARQVNRLQAVISEYTLAMGQTGAHEAAGYRTPVEFLKRECHYSGAHARTVARSGAVLQASLPATSAALRAGAITWPHAATLVRGVDALGPDEMASSEKMWIDKIAVQSGPERLQRTVRARVHEKSPSPIHKPNETSKASKSISLRQLSGRGYEVIGFVSLNDGAIIERALSKIRASKVSNDGTDAVVAIIDQWLRQQSTPPISQRESCADQDSFASLFEKTRTIGQGFMNASPKISRINETNPVTLTDYKATRMSIVDESSHGDQKSATHDHCHHPGCGAVPNWCDYHSILRLLAVGQLEAA